MGNIANVEIELRKLGQLGLEDIDSAKKSLVLLLLYNDIIGNYIDKLIIKMEELGYSKESINKLMEKLNSAK
jgi:hypothetical protein